MINLLLRIFANRRRNLILKELEAFKLESESKIRDEMVGIKEGLLSKLQSVIVEHNKSYERYCTEIKETAINCANDTKNKEHEFHTNESDRKATLKILDNEIECLMSKHKYIKEIVETEERVKSSMMLLLSEKQEEVDKLTKALDKLTN
jgi:hypothetical protein